MDRTQRNGTLLMLLTSAGYALFPVFAKRLDAYGMPPLDAMTWRFLFAAPAIWAIIFLRRMPAPSNPLPRNRLLLMGGFLAVAAALAFYGLQRIPAGTYVVLFFTYPAFVVLFSLLLGARLPLQGWIALAMTMLGVFLTVPDFGAGLGADSGLGIVLAITNAIVVAVYFLIINRLLVGHTAMSRASAWTITGATFVVIALMLFNGLRFPTNLEGWLLLLLMSTVSTAMPIFALNSGIKLIGPAPAAIINTVEPVLSIIAAAIFLGESMVPVQWLGAALIISSVVILQTRGKVRPATTQAKAPVAGD